MSTPETTPDSETTSTPSAPEQTEARTDEAATAGTAPNPEALSETDRALQRILRRMFRPTIQGLGRVVLTAARTSEDGKEIPGTGALEFTANRTFYIGELGFDTAYPRDVMITGISIAGIPWFVGPGDIPLSAFPWRIAREDQQMIHVGQQFRVTFANYGHHEALAAGFVRGYEVAFGFAAQAMEFVILSALLKLQRGESPS